MSRCHTGSWKGISGTCKLLLSGLRGEAGLCVKEQFIVCQSSVLLPSQLNFKNNRNRGGEISCALTWNAFAAFIISCSNAQDIQLISHSRLCDLHIHRNLLGCNLFLNLQKTFTIYQQPVLEKPSTGCQGMRISLVRMESQYYFSIQAFSGLLSFQGPYFPCVLFSYISTSLCHVLILQDIER